MNKELWTSFAERRKVVASGPRAHAAHIASRPDSVRPEALKGLNADEILALWSKEELAEERNGEGESLSDILNREQFNTDVATGGEGPFLRLL